MKCPECKRKCNRSKIYPDTFYCDNCKIKFGEETKLPNEINLVRNGSS